LAIAYMGLHEYDQAIAEFQETLEINPNWTWGYIKLTKAYADAGRCEEAMRTAEDAEAQLHGGSTPLARSWLGYSYAVCGDEERTSAALRELEAYDAENSMDPGAYANVYAGLGEVDLTLDYLEQGVKIRSPDAPYLPIVPALFLEELADEPGYLALMEEMNFGHLLNPGGRP
jgi:tetratricopeptide (TPR) repeat protein